MVDKLRAARAAVLLENLAGSIHGKRLRAFLRKEAAEVRAAGASGDAPGSTLAAASAALASAWGAKEAEPLWWSGVSVGGTAPF